MKRLILGIFLVLTAISFSAPNYVDVNKIKRNGNIVVADLNRGLVYFKKTTTEIFTTSYVYGESAGYSNAKEVLNSYSKDIADTLEASLVKRGETSKAYVDKYSDSIESYTYVVVGKHPKVKDCYVVIVYVTGKDYDDDLGRKANELLDEAESYLR